MKSRFAPVYQNSVSLRVPRDSEGRVPSPPLLAPSVGHARSASGSAGAVSVKPRTAGRRAKRLPREPKHDREHTGPAGEPRGFADVHILQQQAPRAEENIPIVIAGANERERLGARIRHVRSDIEKILEEPESRKSKALRLAMREKIGRAQRRHHQLRQRASENHQLIGVKPTEERMPRF